MTLRHPGRDLAPDVVALVRSRWRERPWLAVAGALVIGITVAAVLATLTGAQRTESAFDRLRSLSSSSDVSAIGDDAPAIASMAGVTAEVQPEVFVLPAGHGTELIPSYNFYPFVRLGPAELNRPVITSGRELDRTTLDEVVVSERLAAFLDVEVGDRMPVVSMSDAYVDALFNGGELTTPDGPTMTATVVGIARTPSDFGQYTGSMEVSPAFFAAHREQIRHYDFVQIRFDDDAARSAAALKQSYPDAVDGAAFGDAAATSSGLSVLATGLRLLALVCAIVGLVVYALVSSRGVANASRDAPTLTALGWTSTRQRAAVVLLLGPPAAIGASIGVVAGAWWSPQALVGLAERVDPDVGARRLDRVLVVLVAVGAVLLALMIIAVLVAGLGKRRRQDIVRHVAPVPIAHPLAASLGVRNALFGRDGSSRPTRTATAVSAIGIAIAFAALSISSSIDHLRAHPALYGTTDERSVEVGESLERADEAAERLRGDDRVGLLARLDFGDNVEVDGSVPVSVLVYDVERGDLQTVLVAGRRANGPNELMMGPGTLQRSGHRVGDEVLVAGPDGSHEYVVVGAMLFPEGDFSHDDGVALSREAARPLIATPSEALPVHSVLFDWAPGVDGEAADAELTASGFRVLRAPTSVIPGDVANIFQVRSLPVALAIFLAFIGAVILVQSVLSSANRRRRELATLRALGATRSVVIGEAVVEAACIAVLAAVAGVSGGAVLGRWLWRRIATSIPVVVRWSASPWETVAAASLLLVVVAVLAIAVGARTARNPVAAAIRRE